MDQQAPLTDQAHHDTARPHGPLADPGPVVTPVRNPHRAGVPHHPIDPDPSDRPARRASIERGIDPDRPCLDRATLIELDALIGPLGAWLG
jgi:hypothetical protein